MNNNSKNPFRKVCATYLKYLMDILGPLAPVLVFYLSGLLVLSVFRTALCINYFEIVSKTKNFLLIFPIGVRIDTILLCYILLLPFLLLIILPLRIAEKLSGLLSAYLAVVISSVVFLEIATFPFMAEFYTRPDRIFLEYMAQMSEVFLMILKGYFAELIIALTVMFLTGWLMFRLLKNRIADYGNCSFLKRVILFIVIMPLLALGIRSSTGHRPANPSTAAFSTSHLVNQLGLNSAYSLAHAYYNYKKHEMKPDEFYGKMEPSEILSRIRRISFSPGTSFTDLKNPLIHYQQSNFPEKPARNLVVILEESLGAEYVGCLGGLPLTPYIDELSKEGLFFKNLYATGTRTVRAIEAIISGFLPTPGKSVVKLGLAQQNFFTIAELLKRKGYTAEFIYGGDSRFDNMRAFFLGNGFQIIYDQKSFVNPVFTGTWGVSDEDLFCKANNIFKAHNREPFFALILTSSNHDPFEFPGGRIKLYDQPKATRHNAMKYADYALGKFFKTARKEPYYKNTIFLIIADHSTRLRGQDIVPIRKFHVPGIIIGPNINPGVCEKTVSQIDMAPTIIDLMGISCYNPMVGRVLLSIPDSVPGRAVMQYGTTNAYMVDKKVVFQRPEMSSVQYTYREGKLFQDKLEQEIYRDALAHALLPGYLYSNRLYCLPVKETPAHQYAESPVKVQ